jgi:molecular chaperone GrpE
MTERPQGSPGMPGREAEDMPVDGEAGQSSPAPDRNLTPSGAGEDRGATAQEPQSGAEQDVERDLESLLGDAEAKRDEYLEIARRAQADFENYRKRMAAEVQAAALRGKAEVVRSFLPVVESFERALDHAEIDPEADAAGEDPVKQGWALTYRDLTGALSAAGVEVVDPKGEKFDPNQHEALSTVQVEGAEAGVVVEVMQKGYQFDGHLIRPARVVVAA